MKRLSITPREGWQKIVESQGLDFHTIDGKIYWDESACYEFTSAEIDSIEAATAAINEMTLSAVEFIIKNKLYKQFGIPDWCVPFIEKSWDWDEPTVYGRYDFCLRPGEAPKLLEYNADTPTALLEASVIQWHWLQTQKQHWNLDQFNSIHEKLIERWERLHAQWKDTDIHFACHGGNTEDFGTTQYLRDTAMQAGINTHFVDIADIGWDDRSQNFVTKQGMPIDALFKLYPWEWLINEEFGKHIFKSVCQFIEPMWKMLLSNKALLPILWYLNPGHENLLPTFRSPTTALNGNYVKKPILSREGANVSIYKNDTLVSATEGEYGEEGYIYQALCELPCFDGNYPVVGSWVVEGEPAGIGIREDTGLVTTNLSRFVPHYFTAK